MIITILKRVYNSLNYRFHNLLSPHNEVHQLEMFIPLNSRNIVKTLMPDDFAIRVFSSRDVDAVIELMHSAGFLDWDHTSIRDALNLCVPDGYILVVDNKSGGIVSTMMARHLSDSLHPYGGRIDWLAADSKYKGKGVGYYAVAAVVNRLIEINYRYIYVTTDDFRIPAIKTFIKAGFVPNLYLPEMHPRWEKVCAQIKLPFEPDKWKKLHDELMAYCEICKDSLQ